MAKLSKALCLLALFSSAVFCSPSLVYWGEAEGIERLSQSQHKVDFFKLANQFESQSNKFFCGPTSSAIVLNALRIRKQGLLLPEDPTLVSAADKQYLPNPEWSPLYQRYSQNNVLELSPKPREVIFGKPVTKANGELGRDFGLQLHQLGALLEAHQLAITVRIADEQLTDEQIKQELIANLGNRDDYVLINYYRKTLNQPGGGHISPLAAYHQGSDSFLIMDVTPNKADWVWVDSATLIASMRTHDTVANRGYVLIAEGLAQ